MREYLTYSYAVVRVTPGAQDALVGVTGVADAPVRLVRAGDLAAALSDVPEEDFNESTLKNKFEDLEWLEAVARAHHAVVERLFAHTAVLPLRLATLYLDEGRVREMLDERRAEFEGLLDQLADHVEWGVKVYSTPPRQPAPQKSRGEPTAESPAADDSPGRAYLRSRRRQQRTREDTWRAAQDAVLQIDRKVRKIAVARARHRPQQGELATGASGQNIANDAYLVPRDSAREFRDLILSVAESFQDIRVEVTGPWAPYSFAEPAKEAGQQEARSR